MTAKPRFAPGDMVRVDDRSHDGHCRTPLYLRGKVGRVESCLGVFGNPEQLAYFKQADRLPLYYVVFRQTEVWPDYDGAANDTVAADIYEHWLERA